MIETGFPHIHCWLHDNLLTVTHAASAIIISVSYMLISFSWLRFLSRAGYTKAMNELARGMMSIFVTCGLHYATFTICIFKPWHYLSAVFLIAAATNALRVAYMTSHALRPIGRKYNLVFKQFLNKVEEEKVLEK